MRCVHGTDLIEGVGYHLVDLMDELDSQRIQNYVDRRWRVKDPAESETNEKRRSDIC